MKMDRKEFEHIALTIRPKLLASAITLIGNETDAEDAVQDTLLKMWTIRDRLSSYRSPEALGLVMTRNFCLDRLRKKNLVVLSAIDSDLDEPERGPSSAEEIMIDRENQLELHDIIGKLPSSQREILLMRHEENMEIGEIAATRGITEGNVRTLLSRARHRIKELFFDRQ